MLIFTSIFVIHGGINFKTYSIFVNMVGIFIGFMNEYSLYIYIFEL